MRQSLLVLCLLALFAVTAYTQGPIDPQNTIVTYPSQLTAGQSQSIFFQERDGNNNTIKLSSCVGVTSPFTLKMLSGPKNAVVAYTNPVCYTNSNNSFSISLNTQIAGAYEFQALYLNTPITSSVHSLTTVPSVMSAQFSFMYGAGLTTAFVGVNATFTIQAVDQYGNTITNCSSIPGTFTIELYQPSASQEVSGYLGPCTNGQFEPTYVVTVTGDWFLLVRYLGSSLNNSQPQVVAYPGYPDGPECDVTGPGMIGTEVGVETWFSFSCSDNFGNPIRTCNDSYTSAWDANFIGAFPGQSFNAVLDSCNEDTGVLNYTYFTTVASVYTSNVYFGGNQSNHLTPFSPNVTYGKADPDETVATGPGVSNNPIPPNVAGQPSVFYIESADQYGNPIPGCFFADWDITIKPTPTINPGTPYCDVSKNELTTNFTANTAQDYTVEIYLNGTLINNQTLYHTVVISNALVGQDAKATYEKTIVAGTYGNFSIEGKDQYGNTFDNCYQYTGSSPFSSWTVTFVSNTNSSITGTGSVTNCNVVGSKAQLVGSYTTDVSGNYSLIIQYNGTPITTSPSNGFVNVKPGPLSIGNSIATGNGFLSQKNQNFVAGTIGTINIIPFDEFNNPIDTCQEVTFNWWINFISQGSIVKTYVASFFDCDELNGTYSKNFNLTIAEPYTINVGSNSSGSPQQVSNTGALTVIPATFDPALTLASATPFGSVGQTFSINATVFDSYGNAINTPQDLGLYFISTSGSTTLNGNMSYLVQNIYQGQFVPTIEGIYSDQVYTLSVNEPIASAVSNVTYGQFSLTYSNATGPAFVSNVVAGTWGQFFVNTYNQYGQQIPSSVVNISMFNVTFQYDNNFVVIPYIISPSRVYALEVNFNATIAHLYNVTVFYGNGVVQGSNFTNVVPGPLDPNTLVINDLPASSSGTGNFTVTGTDSYGNSVDLQSNVVVSFEPACANTSDVNCVPDDSSDELDCTYEAYFAGTYCVEIGYVPTNETFITHNQTVVVGGTACPKSCSNNGYCFPQGQSNNVSNTGDCFCFQGYTGDDCSVKISKKYWNLWLGVGLIVGVPIILTIIGFVVGCLIGRR